jgi:hypothetical protein
MSKLKETKKLLKKYGFHAVKASKLHKKIVVLDKIAQMLTNNADAYFSNRTKCWKLEDMLIKLER